MIEQYSNYNIHHNTINFSVADGITVFNCGDINESDMVADIANNIIHFTGEEPISNSGIKIFRSVADISNCRLGNYQEAIDWYDIVIDTTNSESDSTFAAIDMGEAYLAMGSGKALLQCNNSQFLFESEKAFDRNRKYLIDELMKSQKTGQVQDQDISGGCGITAKLYQNVPNPFNSTSIIKVELYEQCHIELEIFGMAGKKLLTLAKGIYKSGMHEFVINTNLFHDGIYFYSLNVNGANLGSKKMIIVK